MYHNLALVILFIHVCGLAKLAQISWMQYMVLKARHLSGSAYCKGAGNGIDSGR